MRFGFILGLIFILFGHSLSAGVTFESEIDLGGLQGYRPTVSPDSTKVAVLCMDTITPQVQQIEIRVYKISTGNLLQSWPAVNLPVARVDLSRINSFAFSPDSGSLYFRDAAGDLGKFEINSGALLQRYLSKPVIQVTSIHPYLATNTSDEKIFVVHGVHSEIFDGRSGKSEYIFPRPKSAQGAWWLGAVSANGALAAEVNIGGTVKIWNLKTHREVLRGGGNSFYVAPKLPWNPNQPAVVFPDGIAAVKFNSQGQFDLIRWSVNIGHAVFTRLEVTTGQTIRTEHLPTYFSWLPGGSDLAADGSKLALGMHHVPSATGNFRCARLLALGGGTVWEDVPSTTPITDSHVALSPDGKRLVTASDDNKLKIWQTP